MDRLLIVILGLVTGSFLNVCIYRLPQGMSIVHPRSRCPHCGRAVRAWENVPVLGFLLLGGRCQGCRQPIAWRYPVVELLVGAIFLVAYQQAGPSMAFLKASFLLCSLLVLVATDWDTQILPDEVTLGGLLVGLGLAWWVAPGGAQARPSPAGLPAVGWAALSAVLSGGLLWLLGAAWSRWRGRDALGMGDAKMLALLGAFLGLALTWMTLALAALAGSLAGILLATLVYLRRFARQRRRGRSHVQARFRARHGVQAFFSRFPLPFGVFLGAVGAINWFWGDALWRWYLSRTGMGI